MYTQLLVAYSAAGAFRLDRPVIIFTLENQASGIRVYFYFHFCVDQVTSHFVSLKIMESNVVTNVVGEKTKHKFGRDLGNREYNYYV